MMVRLLLLVIAIFWCALIEKGDAASENDIMPFPYDLAYDRQTLMPEERVAVSPDFRFAAYSIRRIPADGSGDFIEPARGTPALIKNSRIYLIGLPEGTPHPLCSLKGNSWRPVWSPDGRYLAFYADQEGAPHLWLYERAANRCRKLSAQGIKAKGVPGDEPIWSPDSRTLYVSLPLSEDTGPTDSEMQRSKISESTVQVQKSGELAEVKNNKPGMKQLPQYHPSHLALQHSTLAAMDVATGQVVPLVRSGATPLPGIGRISPSGKWLSYLSVVATSPHTGLLGVDLAVVPAAAGKAGVSGKPRMLARDLMMVGGDPHRMNYSWHPTRDILVYLKDNALWRVDFDKQGPQKARRMAASLGKLASSVNWFTGDGRAVVVGIDADEVAEGPFAYLNPGGFAIVPLSGGPIRKISFDREHWEFHRLIMQDNRRVWQPDGTSVMVVLRHRETGETAVAGLNPETGRQKLFWRGPGRISDLAVAGRYGLVGSYENFNTPPDIFLFSADFATRKRLAQIDPRLEGYRVGATTFLTTTVPMADGSLRDVRTAVLLPPGAKQGDRLPAVAIIYPGESMSRSAMQYGGATGAGVPPLIFTSRGYAVLLCDVPVRVWGKAGRPVREMTDALLPQIYHAAHAGYVDINRLALSGASYGGYSTAAIVSRTNLFRAAIPVTGLYDTAGGVIHSWGPGSQFRLDAPWRNLQAHLDNAPFFQLDKIETPLLIIHGGADPAISEARKFFNGLKLLGKAAELAVYEGGGHDVTSWQRVQVADAARRMTAFLDLYLMKKREKSSP